MKLGQVAQDATRYRLLRDYLLHNGLVVFQKTVQDVDPFVIDADFFGMTFDDAVDSLAKFQRGVVIEFPGGTG